MSAWDRTVTPLPIANRFAIGLGDECEAVQRAALIQISQNIDAQCKLQEEMWAARDADFASIMRRPVFTTTIERVRPEHMLLGYRPSLVQSRFDQWPAIAVRCNEGGPSNDREQPDQYDAWDLTLYAEVYCRVGPYSDSEIRDHDVEDEVDRQVQRLGAAVHRCISLDLTLGGSVLPIRRPPRIRPSLPFTRDLDETSGRQVVFQGREMSYAITKFAV